jgi:hypothetical protein
VVEKSWEAEIYPAVPRPCVVDAKAVASVDCWPNTVEKSWEAEI